jgi:hypothetical protein
MTDKGTLESGIDLGQEINIGPENYEDCSVFCFPETVVSPLHITNLPLLMCF